MRGDAFAALPRNFGAILADPPWRFETWSDKGKDRSPAYDVMSLADIENLPVKDLAADDCALFLWAINPMLPEALAVMAAWGFRYKTTAFAWAKTTANDKWHVGLGYWTRANAEFCLLGTRGRPKRLNADVRQLVIAPRREHSRKPDCVHERIERLVSGPYCELFARQSRPGWTTWGNETTKFDQVA